MTGFSLFRKEYHDQIYIFGLMLLAASLTLSYFLMSVAQFTLLGNWLLEGAQREKLHKLYKNKALWFFLLIYLIHVAGVFYSHDLGYALDDLRIKLPLLALPVIIATSPQLTNKILHRILLVHVFATFAATWVCFGYSRTHLLDDIRDMSLFISHIRFSLNICFDIIILLYFVFGKNTFFRSSKVLFIVLVLWFLYYLYISESVTGIITLMVTLMILGFFWLLTHTRPATWLTATLFLIAALAAASWITKNRIEKILVLPPVDIATLDSTTKYGNRYSHDIGNELTENGNYTWYYVCWDELRETWNQRSSIKFDSTDRKKQPVMFTLVRYMTSLNLRKDRDGINSLSQADVRNIENGVANVTYLKKGSLASRLKNYIWEYKNYKITGDARGQSLMQRIELWQNSANIIRRHPWFGVGTGDVDKVFAAGLYIGNSLLYGTGLRSHNQYLSVMIAFGIAGLLLFIAALFIPPIILGRFRLFLFKAFFLILLISMFTEDTLESQPGVTFAAFFYSLFVFGWGRCDDAASFRYKE